MRIAFVIENAPRVYSGGRVHGWLIIQALLALGNQVVVYTEGLPPFFDAITELAGWPEVVQQRSLKRLRIAGSVDMVCSFPILATAWAHREAKRLKVPHAAWVLDPCLMCKKYAPAVGSRMHYSEEYRSALRAADWIVASNATAIPFIREWTGHKNIVAWTPGINSVVADKVAGKVSKQARRVVAITRMTEHKNFNHVVEVLSSVSCIGTIITSFDAVAMRRALQSVGIGQRIQVVDKPDDWQKFRAFYGASVFLSASQYEGLGIPQMEAMYCGARPVVYDFPVMREICGNVALYARWKDVGSLTDRLKRALMEPLTGRVLGAGRRYSFEAMLKRAPRWISG